MTQTDPSQLTMNTGSLNLAYRNKVQQQKERLTVNNAKDTLLFVFVEPFNIFQ